MLVVRGQAQRVARYLEKVSPKCATLEWAKGLVVPVRVGFSPWHEGQMFEADAFIDTGCDCTLISWRWLVEQVGIASEEDAPYFSDGWKIEEDVEVEIAGHRFGIPEGKAALRAQGDFTAAVDWLGRETWQSPEWRMAGHEDLLLGRDFLIHNRLVLAFSGVTSRFSLLVGGDADNDRRMHVVAEAMGL